MFSFEQGASMPTSAEQFIAIEATDDEIDAIIEECGGDPREAIRALLHDLAALAIDSEAAVSRGYVRGRLLPFRLKEGEA
jgi:hypothetical protein